MTSRQMATVAAVVSALSLGSLAQAQQAAAPPAAAGKADAVAKNITVVIQNTEHRPVAK